MDKPAKPTKAAPFKKGVSGNPAGRPKKPVAGAARLREMLATKAEAVMELVIEQAMAGDIAAAKLILERVVPSFKPVEQPTPVPIPSSGSLTDQGRAVLQAVANGTLAPAQGAQLVAAIGTLARVAEIDELARRIQALEDKHDHT